MGNVILGARGSSIEINGASTGTSIQATISVSMSPAMLCKAAAKAASSWRPALANTTIGGTNAGEGIRSPIVGEFSNVGGRHRLAQHASTGNTITETRSTTIAYRHQLGSSGITYNDTG